MSFVELLDDRLIFVRTNPCRLESVISPAACLYHRVLQALVVPSVTSSLQAPQSYRCSP